MTTHDPRSVEAPRLLPTLVLTKTFTPPDRAGLIRRTDLLDRLTDHHNRQVTLIHAPAGYGKSTLLMQWAKADPIRRFGWVTLDETENEPGLLWRYIIYAVQALSPGLGDDALRLIDRPNPDLRAVASQLVNSLVDSAGRLVFVLDDYHVITNQACHDSIQYFMDHMPKSAQIAFGTRIRPPLALARQAGSGMVLEIDATSLQFTFEETQAVLERGIVRVSSEQAARVHRETEGWPVGVVLSSSTRAFGSAYGHASGSRRGIRGYLLEQMLDGLSDEDRQTLRDWSILRRLNGALADFVTRRSGSTTRMAQLSESNLLLRSLDDQGHWYRFHDLLRAELRKEFEQLPRDHQLTAHARAMDWWLENGNESEAVSHAIEAHEFERGGELICAYWLEYLLTGRLETLRTWISRFPPSEMLAYPPVLVVAGWVYGFSGDVEQTRRYEAAARGTKFDQAMPDGTASYESAVAMLRAGLGLYGLTDANENAEKAYQLEPVDSPWRPLAASLAGVTRYGLGRYEDAKTALIEAARSPAGPDGMATYARGQLALLAMSEGEWEEASRQADLACAMIEELNIGNVLSSGAAQVAAAAVAAHAGKHGLASQRLGSFARVQAVLSDAIPFDAFQLHLVAAETELELGNHNAAAIHANAASSRLEAFGDGGVFETKLATILATLELSDEVDVDLTSEEQRVILTDRERQVLELLPTDLPLRGIGEQLFVSRNTAKTHVAHLYKKLGVPNRSAAIERARQLDLI